MSEMIPVKTWICANYPLTCDHRWQFSGDALNVSPYDLTEAQLLQQFPTLPGLLPGRCPVCFARGVTSVLGLSIQPENKSMVRLATDDEIESYLIEDIDAQGNVIMEESGETYQDIVIQGGQAVVVEKPVMKPKMRPIDTIEANKIKQERNQKQDELARIVD